MKGKEYVVESTGVIQKAEVGPSQQHTSNIQANIQSMIMKKLHCLASSQDIHPNVIHVKLLKLWQSRKCETNHDRLKDKVKIMSGKCH